tara:strand:- start:112 stop:840 length:729 start_codon:yes stop_codon:yes gene_type:complete
LSKKVAFISGGSKGIGRAIAKILARDGFNIIIGYKTNKLKAKELVDSIKNFDVEAMAVYCDISKRKLVKKIFNQVGRIDVLINNAGVSQPKKFLDITDEDWIRMFNINIQGAFICSQEALPGMIKNKWGRIINITSIGGQWGGVDQVHYASAKAGLIGLTMSLARLYGNSGITANSISPGIIKTDMTSNINSISKKLILKNIPISRFGDPNEIAEVVSFLASNNSSYITGQTINVNGGMLRT